MESNNYKRKVNIILAFFAGVVVTALIVGLFMCGIGNYKLVNGTDYEIMSGFFKKYKDLAAVDTAIDKYFYLDTESDDSVEEACKGLVNSLGDKYSIYMSKEEFTNYMAASTGRYSGIGISFVQDKDGHFVIMSVNKNTPADKAGLKQGDYITKVDGKEYKDQDSIANDMRGKSGTTVDVTYERNGKETTVKITRGEIQQTSVKSEVLDNGIGHIMITEFINNTSSEFKAALKDIQSKGCDKLILDLRDNGGGIVDEAVGVADEFLDEGIVAYTEDKQGNSQKYKAKNGKTSLETLVLVNENSASSSEILAGALKDNGYKLVGSKTFGKGIIQSTMELKDGSALKLTIAQYFTPDGYVVHNKGIEPNIKVKNTNGSDDQLKKAVELLK